MAVGEALKASSVQSYWYRDWRWLDFLHVLALWGSPVLCPVPPCARAMWLLTQREQEEGTTPRCAAVPEDGAGKSVLVLE